MLGQGWFSPIHWLVIGIVALLLFGNRLPEVARSLGRAFKEFKRGLHDVSDELGREPPPESERRPDKLQPPQDRSEPHKLDQPAEPVEHSNAERQPAQTHERSTPSPPP